MGNTVSPRKRYAVLTIATIAVGLIVHKLRGAIPPAPRDIAGDALWAAMMFWIVSFAAPAAHLSARAVVALGIAFGVEISQMYPSAGIDALRSTTLGRLVLGTDFDARDLVSYSLGVAIAAGYDYMFMRARLSAGSTKS